MRWITTFLKHDWRASTFCQRHVVCNHKESRLRKGRPRQSCPDALELQSGNMDDLIFGQDLRPFGATSNAG